MSLTSMFDHAHSEFSQRSSSERGNNNSNNRNHQSDTSPAHHNRRLDEMYKASRHEAEIQHAVKERMRNENPSKAVIKKTKSRRQQSNIKSAEICREAKRIYIKRLEDAILEEENVRLAITGNILDLIAEGVKLDQRKKRLEERSSTMEQAGLLLSKNCGEAGEVDTMRYGLFAESNSENEMMEWEVENQSMSYVSHFEEDVERLISDDDDADEAVAVVPAPCSVEEMAGATTRYEKMVSVECGLTKGIGSPVSVLDIVRQEGDEKSVRPRVGV